MIQVYIQEWNPLQGNWKDILAEILKADYGMEQCPEILRDRFEKPYFAGNPLYFNISHSGEYLAIAVSKESVGVDIQKPKHIFEGMYDKIVQPEERGLIGKNCQKDFIRLWTLKESFVKAEGKGLRIPMKEYYFVRENDSYFVNYGGQRVPWLFNIEEMLLEDYVISVCGMEKEVVWNVRRR